MPKFGCSCGEILNLSGIPAANQWLCISDVDYDNFTGKIDAEKLYLSFVPMLRCPKCDTLWFFWNGFGEPAKAYDPRDR
ncbi:MAG: hypothetical protein JXJ17_10960 [Anaerolineae bacterium]|nr:hypothetical protein [Anaerolineae bacterium]